jgi:hypothetical protein
MATIYKLKHIAKDKTICIYVFSGTKEPNQDYVKNIFTEKEKREIKEEDIKVVFLEDYLHKDDTLEIIKKKIIKYTDIQASYVELFLFIKQYQKLNSIQIYQSITQNEKLNLTRDRLINFLSNIDTSEKLGKIDKKDLYTYEDILSLGLDEKPEILMDKALGQKIIAPEGLYAYTVNPYLAEASSDNFLENSKDLISTTNKNILMDSGEIYDNVIYACDAMQVLQMQVLQMQVLQGQVLQVSGSITKIYFPYLFERGILNVQQLLAKKQELIIESEKMLDASFNQNIESVNLFYDIYNGRDKKEIPFTEYGIKNIELIMHPEYFFNLPLDIVFKLLHASETVPYIKYNLGKRLDKVLRLYANSISINSVKIPYLNKAMIFKLNKTIGRTKSVSVYIETSIDGEAYNVICEFFANGSIAIKTDFSNAVDIAKLNKVLYLSVNNVINQVRDYISQNGYSMDNFERITQPRLEIVNINYVMHIPVDLPFHLKKISGCVSPIFSVVEDNIKKGIVMRFKRVANYNEMNSQDAFIVDKINVNTQEDEIIQGLALNFNLPAEKAREKYAEFITSVQVVTNAFNNKKVKVKNNPGFLVTIIKEQFSNMHLITINGIDHINYLDTIPIYIDALLRLTHFPTKTSVSIARINKQCKVASAKSKQVIEDIVAVSEKPYFENKKLIIVDEELVEEPSEAEPSEAEPREAEPSKSEAGPSEAGPSKSEALNEMEVDYPDDEGTDILNMLLGFGEEEEIEANEIGANEIGANEIGANEIGANEIGANEIGANEIGGALPEEEEQEEQEQEEQEQEEQEQEEQDEKEEEQEEQEQEEQIKGVYWNKGKKKWCAQLRHKGKIISVGCYKTQKEAKDAYDIKHNLLYEDKSSNESSESESEEETIVKKSIEGQSLGYPNPFDIKLYKYEPNLFLKENEGKFNSYSRSCRWTPSARRHPVLLTNKEKEYIDKNHPKSYENAIEYGSDPKKKYWYICPRYWSLRDNISLTEEEAKSGKYGDIIPAGSKKIPPGGAIFDYEAKLSPGFMEQEKHPNGLCVPCCYTNWDGPKQKKLRKQCMINPGEEPAKAPAKKEPKLSDDYIMGVDKFPLDASKYGYLPYAIQKFLNIDNKQCQVSASNANLKPDHPCMLRHGVETSKTQSFIACIGDIVGRHFNNDKPLSIVGIKEKMAKALNLDLFMTLQNGALIEIFSANNETYKEDIMPKEFLDSKIYKSILKNKDANKLFNKIVKAYEAYKAFLSKENTSEVIDYTYTWDLICKANKELFPKGINMVILDMLQDDGLDKINIVCPSNHYSLQLFNEKLETIIILKFGNYYEPVYRYTLHKTIRAVFKMNDSEIKETLKLIQSSINNKCPALPSIASNVYTFKRNIGLESLVSLLKKYEYTITTQVMNYAGKVVGVLAAQDQAEQDQVQAGFIPCYPSGPLLMLPTEYTWLDDPAYLESYSNTVKFLMQINKESKKAIPCKPAYKIVEEIIPGKRYVIGVLTETNQYIKVKTPYSLEDPNDPIKTIQDIDYVNTESEILFSKEIEEERNNEIHKIKLDTRFFNAFRNTVRILINKFQNRAIKKEIQQIMDSSTLLYLHKLEKVDKLIQTLMMNAVEFREYPNERLNDLSIIGSCYTLNEADCAKKLFCNKGRNSSCRLVVPLTNFVNGNNNISIYFGRIADEILRYNRIKSFIFKPTAFLSFNDVNYDMTEDELIINAALLTQDYFENLVPMHKNSYTFNVARDMAVPNLSLAYTNEVQME